ncbi:MAG: CPBP family intramembrane glutamic endopeptidase [Opitutaceae bacterium]
MSDQLKTAALGAQWIFALGGCVLFWRYVASPHARASRSPSPLPGWEVALPDLLIFLLHILAGGFIASIVAGLVAKPLGLSGDRFIIGSNAMAQLGLLGGVALYALPPPRRFALGASPFAAALKSGSATFLIAMPFVSITGIVWSNLLTLCGFPVEDQLAVQLFARTTSPLWLLLLSLSAIVVAPLAEELIFRAGIFRYVRTRLPRWGALLLPACLFAAMHLSLATFAQLAVLGIIFALAYERTGNLGTAIVAHALFNLNMVVLLLVGVRE